MNFLELCKQTRKEARIPGTGPSAVTSQTGILSDVVNAVQRSWIEIQTLHLNSWKFMGSYHSSVLIDGQAEYAPADLGLDPDVYYSPRWLAFAGQRPMTFIPWEEYNLRYRHQQSQSGVPRYYTKNESDNLVFYPTPNTKATETPLGIFFSKRPATLDENSDTPDIATRHHWAIVWKAVMDLSANESDSVIYQKASTHFDDAMSDLNVDELPPLKSGDMFSYGGS